MKIRMSILLLIGVLGMSEASLAQSKDYRSQVLFMYNFIKYVRWPVDQQDFVIGVLGESPIVSELKKLASIKKTPEGKTIIIKIIGDVNADEYCSMIYISDGHSREISKLLETPQLHQTLIVAERDGMAKKGAEICFFTYDDDKLGFSISRKNMESKNLKVSGELLRLAELAD